MFEHTYMVDPPSHFCNSCGTAALEVEGLEIADGYDPLMFARAVKTRTELAGVLPAKQSCVGAPYVIREIDLDLQDVRYAVQNGRAVSPDPRQQNFDYQ